MTGRGEVSVHSASRVLEDLDYKLRRGRGRGVAQIPLGFPLLDDVLGGGVRPGDLLLLGGPPGVGKTVATLQWARQIALTSRDVLYVCYEHSEAELLMRLLAMDLAEMRGIDSAEVEKVRMRLQQNALETGSGISDIFGDDDVAATVLSRFETYASSLHLIAASGGKTGVAEIGAFVAERNDPVIFVDYLQKVAVLPEPPTEEEKVTRVVEGLKDLALRTELPVISVVAADREGLTGRRLRAHHLRGSSSLVYEADVVLLLNEKRNAVSKAHLAYDPVRASTFGEWVVFSLEKNRSGPALIDLEYRKDFSHHRFEPAGGLVAERLVDERLEPEL